MNVRKLYFDRLNRKLNAIADKIRLIKRAQGADQKDPWQFLDHYLKDHEIRVRDLLDAVQQKFGPAGAKMFQQLLESNKIAPDTILSSDLVRNILNLIRSKPEYRPALDAVPALMDELLTNMPQNERKIVTDAVKAHLTAPQARQPAQQNAAQPSPQAQQTQKATQRLVPVQLSPDGKGGVYHDPETGYYWAIFPDGRKVWVPPDEMAKAINAREMSKNRPWFQQTMSNPHYTDRSKVLEDQGMTEDAERMFKFHLQQFAPRSFDPNRTALLRARAAEFAENRDGKKVITGNSVKAAIVADYLIQRGRGLAHEDEVFRNPATAGWPTNMPPRTKEQQAQRIAESVKSSVERFEDIRDTLLGLSPELRLRVWSSLPKETRQQLLKAYRDLDYKTFGRGYIEEKWKRIKSDIVKWGIIPIPPERPEEPHAGRSPRPDSERQLASGKPQQTRQQIESAQKSPTERADQYFAAASMPPPRPTESTTRPPYESFAFTRTSMPTYPFAPQTPGTTETTDQSHFEQPMLRPEIMNQSRLEQPVLRPEMLASVPGPLFQYLPLRPGTTETTGQPNAGQPAQGLGQTGFGNGPLASGPFPLAQIPTYPYPAQKPSLPETNRGQGIV